LHRVDPDLDHAHRGLGLDGERRVASDLFRVLAMPKTADDFLKALIGQLVITNADLAGQIETLTAENLALKAKLTEPPTGAPV
jgi:hypothetical protein